MVDDTGYNSHQVHPQVKGVVRRGGVAVGDEEAPHGSRVRGGKGKTGGGPPVPK